MIISLLMFNIFDRSVCGHEASRQLVTRRQGRWSAADYAIEFRTLVATFELNVQALTALGASWRVSLRISRRRFQLVVCQPAWPSASTSALSCNTAPAVKKKDGSLCPCIDYGRLIDITVKNRYPMPLMSSAFKILQGAKICTKLYIRNAYHLMRIKKGDEWKTTINTPLGHFEYRVLPFRLVHDPVVF